MNARRAFGDVILERLVRNKDFIELVIGLNVSWLTGVRNTATFVAVSSISNYFIRQIPCLREVSSIIANRRAKGGANVAPRQSQRCNRVGPYFYYILLLLLLNKKWGFYLLNNEEEKICMMIKCMCFVVVTHGHNILGMMMLLRFKVYCFLIVPPR